jgi:hypothetical protein
MQQDKLFTEIRQELSRRDSKYSYNKLVDLVLSLGVSKSSIVSDLTKENKLVCRATAYSLLNHRLKRVPLSVSNRLTEILRMAVNESIKINLHYKSFLTYQTIDNQLEAIKAAKAYLATLETDIPLEVIAEDQDMDSKRFDGYDGLNFMF